MVAPNYVDQEDSPEIRTGTAMTYSTVVGGHVFTTALRVTRPINTELE